MPGLVMRTSVAVAALLLTAVAVPAGSAAAAPSPVTDAAPAVSVGSVSGDLVRVLGGQVIAPAPGSAVALTVERVDGHGSVQVVSTDLRGVVSIDDGAAAASAPADDSLDKCSDSAYSFINGARWPASYNWRYRVSTTPNSLSAEQAIRALRKAAGSITQSSNKCGLADESSATARYLGTTRLPSDVTSAGGCGAPSGQNVTEFGAIQDTGVLAITCVYSAGPDIVAASIRINTHFGWRVNGACTSAYDVVATMTHEFGHAFGLGHVDETDHRNLTMSSGINSSCSGFESNLGRGDVLALRALY